MPRPGTIVNLTKIKDAADRIVSVFHPSRIILFGSYAYGQPKPDSDVDLLVEMETELSNVAQAVEIRKVVDFSFPVDLLVRTQGQISTRLALEDFFISEILTRGKVLYEASH